MLHHPAQLPVDQDVAGGYVGFVELDLPEKTATHVVGEFVGIVVVVLPLRHGYLFQIRGVGHDDIHAQTLENPVYVVGLGGILYQDV